MGGLGFQELVVILLIVLVLFGAAKIPQIMGGLGEGIKNFKKSMREDDEEKKRRDDNEEKKRRDEGQKPDDKK